MLRRVLVIVAIILALAPGICAVYVIAKRTTEPPPPPSATPKGRVPLY
jgi:hypothetical protein